MQSEAPINRRHLHYKAWSFYAVQYLLIGWIIYWMISRFPVISLFLCIVAAVAFYQLWNQSLAPRYHSREMNTIMRPLAQYYRVVPPVSPVPSSTTATSK